MKQISYDFDWMTLAGAMVGFMKESGGVEDGIWEINLRTESLTGHLSQPTSAADPRVLPGHLVRIIGIYLLRVFDLGPMCIKVENGLITEVWNGINRDNSRPEQSSESIGANSGSSGKSVSRTRRRR
jgi:hypothetical protein